MTTDLHHGDCLEVMRTLAENSVDAVVTDPPYGIRFMGKAWDGEDIERRQQARMTQAHDPQRRAGDNGGHRSLAAEAGKYDRSFQAFQAFSEDWAREALRVLKPGGHLVSFASTRTYHRMVCGIENADFEIRDQLAWVFGSGFPKSYNLDGTWTGWGTALKPAWEPIVLARKPLDGTIANNVAQWGAGVLNIDGCRVELQSGEDISTQRASAPLDTTGQGWGFTREIRDNRGRWPANFCHDGSADVLDSFPTAPGAQAPVTGREPTRQGFSGHVYGAPSKQGRKPSDRRDAGGSAARFFYCAKASSADREEGLQESGLSSVVTAPASGALQNSPANDIGLSREKARRNVHPTVKPTALMRWLCRLVTPTGGVVLDPFMGSGSTGKAAVLEGFRFIGVEREADYLAIARARIHHVTPVSP